KWGSDRKPRAVPMTRRKQPCVEGLESRQLLSTYVVTNTGDSGAGSLRAAILAVNADRVGGVPSPDVINFDIPASTDPDLDVPVPGFDPVTQTWRITPNTPLPAITNTVWLDGYTQAEAGVPFRYPSQVSLAVQSLTVLGSPTGGSFTLSTLAPLPPG